MKKSVILIVDLDQPSEDTTYFNTTGEAVEYAEALRGNKSFDIYTIYKSGKLGGIMWELAVDTATNLREIETNSKRPKKAYKRWSRLETQTLVDNYNGGMPVRDLAAYLHRPYKSVYGKLSKLGVLKPKGIVLEGD